MATLITKNSSTASSVPTAAQLVQGELAVNVTDKRLFTENSSGTVVELGTNPSTLALPNGSANGVAYLNGSKVLTTGSALTFDGTDFKMPNGGSMLLGASASGASLLLINGTAAAQRLVLGTSGTDAVINATRTSGTSPNLLFQLEASEQMRLTSTGLGIGTSSPAQTLHVKTSTAATPITLGVLSNATTLPALSFNGAYASTTMAGTYSLTGSLYTTVPSGAAQYFSIADSIKLTLDSSGNLGLGVTPSAWASFTGLQVGALGGLSIAGAVDDSFIGSNVYYNAGFKFAAASAAYATAYRQSSGQHRWLTSTATGTAGNTATMTQAMTLDASGRLGIGVTSPATPLHVYGGSNVSRYEGSSTSQPTYQTFYNGSADKVYFGIENSSGSGIIGTGAAYGMVLSTASTNPLVFGTNATERARIDSSGNLLVGLTSNTNTFSARVVLSYDSGTTQWGIGPWVSDGTKFYISANGGSQGVYLNGTAATSWTAWSDERVKADLEPIENAAQKVASLRAVTGRYIEDKSNTRKPFLIAQDVLAVLPEAVDTSNPDRFGLSYTDTIPLLVAAIKELKAEVDSLKAALESK